MGWNFRFGFPRRWQACTPPVDTRALRSLAWHSQLPVKIPRWLGILAPVLFLPWAVAADSAPKAKAAKAPDPSFAAVTETPGLPRVLLIGDSISMGYTLPVRLRLAGQANVLRPATNCGESARGLKSLDEWLGLRKWDVIHFNFGLHDLKYLDEKGAYVTPDKGKQVATVEQYEQNLRALVVRLKRTGAKLIFATTTPVPAGSQGRVEKDELRYNEVAVRVMWETGIAVDDLHALAAKRQGQIQLPHNVHFTPDGYEQLAAQVTASIRAMLPGVPP
jgi:lysophospholipase L1-like esterase